MLFNEPKLLKCRVERCLGRTGGTRFSALQRAEIAEMVGDVPAGTRIHVVSVLFNEPKLLKSTPSPTPTPTPSCFSALQRAEIAEMGPRTRLCVLLSRCFSALQRAEIAEITSQCPATISDRQRFSALQRAEIAEMERLDGLALVPGAFQCSSTSRNC